MKHALSVTSVVLAWMAAAATGCLIGAAPGGDQTPATANSALLTPAQAPPAASADGDGGTSQSSDPVATQSDSGAQNPSTSEPVNGEEDPESEASAGAGRLEPVPSSLSQELLATIGRAQMASAGRGYSAMVRAWHVPPTAPPSRTPQGRPRLVLETINTQERIELTPARDDGGFSGTDLLRATYVLRDSRANKMLPIDARALDLAYRLQRHFNAKAVRILSAYRVARRRASNHSRGRALDLVIPGSRNPDVAAYARTLGFVGVGVYPSSGFVHVDTRPRSYFWIDASGPGQRSRNRPIFPRLAAQADAKAIARGESPPSAEPAPTEDTEGSADNEMVQTTVDPATRAPATSE